MAASTRAFVLRHTRLRPVPGLGEVRLHLADDVLPLWRALQVETGDPDIPLPFWAFAWGGGLAIGRYLRDHPETVAGRRVFDLGSGSGLCAIAALVAGATEAIGADIDPYSAAAIALNAKANGRRVAILRRDILDEEPPDVDVILAGDCWYEEGPRHPRPGMAAPRSRSRDRSPGRRSRPAVPAHRRPGQARQVRGPDDDRSRGPRVQGGRRLHPASG